jgi:hypothetical protein
VVEVVVEEEVGMVHVAQVEVGVGAEVGGSQVEVVPGREVGSQVVEVGAEGVGAGRRALRNGASVTKAVIDGFQNP